MCSIEREIILVNAQAHWLTLGTAGYSGVSRLTRSIFIPYKKWNRNISNCIIYMDIFLRQICKYFHMHRTKPPSYTVFTLIFPLCLTIALLLTNYKSFFFPLPFSYWHMSHIFKDKDNSYSYLMILKEIAKLTDEIMFKFIENIYTTKTTGHRKCIIMWFLSLIAKVLSLFFGC